MVKHSFFMGHQIYWRKSTVLSPIGETPEDVLAKVQLAKVQWTFANWRNPLGMYWRKYSGLSPTGETPRDVLAKV